MKNRTSFRFKLTVAIVSIAAVAMFVWAGTGKPTPAVGLYWLISGDPTVAPGVSAPQYQLGIRTDVPTLYYHSGTGNLQWTSLSGGGGGGGTVTSISCDAGTSCTPDPITMTGVITVNQQLNVPNGQVFLTTGGTLNNWDPWTTAGVGRTTYVEIDPNTAITTITGLVAGNDGDYVTLWNGGNGGKVDGGTGLPDTVTLINQDSRSSALNRFWIADGKMVNIANNDGVVLRYDNDFGWVCFSCSGSLPRAQEISVDPAAIPTAIAAGSAYIDYDPFTSGGAGTTSNVRQDVSGTGIATITGFLAAGAPNSEGRLIYWQNISMTGSIAFTCNDPASSAANQIICPNNQTVLLPPGGSAVFVYDDTATMWRVASIAVSSGNSTIDGRAVVTPCVANFNSSLPQAIIDNYNPACLSTNTFIQVASADNSGTTITGIDAIGNNLPIGSQITICNETVPGDAGVITLRNLSSNSAIGNRILTPGAGRQRNCTATPSTYCQQNSDCPSVDASNTCEQTDSDFNIGPDQCAVLEYINAGAENALAWPEWMVMGGQSRFNNVTTQNMNLYPILYTDELDGTVDDYNPTCTGAGGSSSCAALHAYMCVAGNDAGVVCGEAGDNLDFQSNAMVQIDVGSGGATLQGLHYEPAASAVERQTQTQGLYKWICNAGPGSLLVENIASSNALANIDDGANGDNRGNFVVLPEECFEVYHQRDIGHWMVQGKRDPYFHERDTNITKGLAVSGNNPTSGFPNTTFFTDNIDGPNATGFTNYLRDVHAYVSASPITRTTLAVVADGTVSGGGTIQNVALNCSANGANAFAIEVTGGSVFFGLGAQAPNVWSNSPDTEASNLLAVGGALGIGGAPQLIGTLTTYQQAQATGAPASVSSGTLSTDASNFTGTVTGPSATSVTLTFSGSALTTSHCGAWADGSSVTAIAFTIEQSATAPVFFCSNTTTGVAATCPTFDYQCWRH